jgi:hypothetical protein
MKLIKWIKELIQWDRYWAYRKSEALYRKLHKYDGVKFTKKDAIKLGNKAMKDKRKKERERQEEMREHEHKQ